MVSPASAAPIASSASSAAPAASSRAAATPRGSGSADGSRPGAATKPGDAASFAEVLAGADGGQGEARTGLTGTSTLGTQGMVAGEGSLAWLGALGAGSRFGGAAGRNGAGAKSDGALDGSAEARDEGVDPDEVVDGGSVGRGVQGGAEDALSPWARHCQQLTAPAPPPAMALPCSPPASSVDPGTREAAEAPAQAARASLQELMPALVKKVAWSGDGTRGAVRLEIGAGSLAGSTLLVQAEGSRVRVQLDAPAGTDAATWQKEIRTRLEARGLDVDDVEVS